MTEKLQIDYLLIQDYFTQEELNGIWAEFEVLQNTDSFEPPEETGSATIDGIVLKQNSAIFFDKVYKHPKYSPTVRAVRKMFEGPTSEYANKSLWNMGILETSASATLVSYYENADHYKPHKDNAVVTVLHWLWKEPKAFEGGELTLLDTGEKIPLTNNTMLMFPAHCWHEVSPVIMEAENLGKGLGRYCITTFLYTTLNPDAAYYDYINPNANR
jgi:predicted 2-oxoglutarate/Fe(II)-dependent dioxygenase YbiX